MTLGDALEAVDLKRAAGPGPRPEEPDDDDDDDDDEEIAPPAPAAPTPPDQAPPADDEDPDSFAQLAGKVATSVGVGVLAAIHRRQGREPNELDDDDVERLELETTKAVRRGIGDRAIPWWAPVVSAWGMAYFSMGNGARVIGQPPPDQLTPDPDPARPPSPVPPPPPFRPSTPGAKPPPVKIMSSAPRVA